MYLPHVHQDTMVLSLVHQVLYTDSIYDYLVLVVQECYIGEMRGVNQVTETYNVRSSTRFRVRICSGDGNFVDICSDNVNATRIARLACDNVGYQYGKTYLIYSKW